MGGFIAFEIFSVLATQCVHLFLYSLLLNWTIGAVGHAGMKWVGAGEFKWQFLKVKKSYPRLGLSRKFHIPPAACADEYDSQQIDLRWRIRGATSCSLLEFPGATPPDAKMKHVSASHAHAYKPI